MGVVGRNQIEGEGAWVAGSLSVMKGLLPATYHARSKQEFQHACREGAASAGAVIRST